MSLGFRRQQIFQPRHAGMHKRVRLFAGQARNPRERFHAMAMEALVGVPMPSLPAWSKLLQHLGLVSLPGNQFDPMNAAHAVTFQRDSVALILPLAGGLPRVFFGLTAVSALAAMAASATAQLVAIANSVSDESYPAS